MFRTLLRKQMQELALLFRGKRKNKKETTVPKKSSPIGFILLFALIALSCGFAFYGMAVLFSSALLVPDVSAIYPDEWLYFALMGMVAIVIGTLGSIFTTYAILYKASDNEFLLSLPIPPSTILLVRMVAVSVPALVYVGLAWIPGCLCFALTKGFFPLAVVTQFVLWIMLTLLVTVLSCFLGWVVALIAARLKNKSIITVLVSVLGIGLYYVVYFRLNRILNSLVENAEVIGATIRSKIFPLYALGFGGTGDVLYTLAFSAITLVLFAVCCLILFRTFTGIVTMNKGSVKKEYQAKAIGDRSVESALFHRELSHFLASPTYMLNSGLGVLIMPILAIAALIKAPALLEAAAGLETVFPAVWNMLPLASLALILMIVSMDGVSASSVSLEGKNLWVIRSLPVDTERVLLAKAKLHIAVNAVPAAVSVLLIGIACRMNVIDVVLSVLATVAYVFFCAYYYLALNLKMPMLDWTNEAIPVKSSAPVAIALFGGWAIALVVGGGYFFLCNLAAPWMYLALVTVLFGVLAWIIRRWVRTRGVILFEEL